MNEVKLSPPWITFFHELRALFENDKEVKIQFDYDNYCIKIFVDNDEKADALRKLLPEEKWFGSVVVNIIVIPANMEKESKERLFRKAFAGNDAVKDIVVVDDVYSFDAGYVVFSGKPVQFFNDDLSSLNGIKTMLYQDIAKDVFGDVDGMFFFCTEKL